MMGQPTPSTNWPDTIAATDSGCEYKGADASATTHAAIPVVVRMSIRIRVSMRQSNGIEAGDCRLRICPPCAIELRDTNGDENREHRSGNRSVPGRVQDREPRHRRA